MRRALSALLLLLVASLTLGARASRSLRSGQARPPFGGSVGGPFDVHFIDVEGGRAPLMVSPSAKSLFVVTVWPGFSGRAETHTAATARGAGVNHIASR